jgi:hypothetical protein
MRLVIAAVLTLASFAAAAQQGAEPRQGRRAPLANVEDLEPAVDVGEPQIALIPAQRPPPQPTAPDTAAAPPAGEPVEPAAPVPQPAAPRPAAPAARAMDSLDLGTTSITGNAELPKVLYIVPWKKSDLGDLVGRPVNTLLDEVLAPVDPEVFGRHLSYYETLHGASQEE